ncbi:hypothetical protein CSA37_13120 [Candidatus Fermentibacteria bacterium]|nr:MAG: hypothetical protein CSA37_13120 [Candidatus Fermentibacteria bacterium]
MGVLSFLITLLLFASVEVASKPLMGSVDPLVLTLWRFIFGLLILVPVMLARRRRGKIKPSSMLLMAAMGVMNTFLSMSFLQLAVKHTSAARAAAIFCSNPLFVLLIASVIGWEKLGRKRLLGLILGLSGLFIVTDFYSFSLNRGTVYALLASVTFALYILVSRKASLSIDPVTVNVVSFSFGLAALGIYLAIRGIDMNPAPLFAELPSLLYLGMGVSGIAYIAFLRTIKEMGAGNASTIFLLKPAVATVLAIIFLGEAITVTFVSGLVVIGTGSWMIIKAGRS